MTNPGAGFYDSQYERRAAEIQAAIRREVYGDDFGQTSWIKLEEARDWFGLLHLDSDNKALEVACGSGGLTCALARTSGAACTGVDINPHAIESALRRAEEGGLTSTVRFQAVDAGKPLPFDPGQFDAVVSNDSINHIPDRPVTFAEWYRVIRPGGLVLVTDPVVVTGQVTSDEIRRRSSIGYFLFTPRGYNEEILKRVGFDVLDVADLTQPVADISRRWADARARRRDDLVEAEGASGFDAFQDFLEAVHTLSASRRLSRFRYFAKRPVKSGATDV